MAKYYFDMETGVTHHITSEEIAGETIYKSLCSDRIEAPVKLSDLSFVDLMEDQVLHDHCPHCLDAKFEIDLHNDSLTGTKIKASGGSDLYIKPINDGRQCQIKVDIAGHIKDIHFHKKGLDKLIADLQKVSDVMQEY